MTRMRSEKGVALIEAAITLPLILLICVGIFEFGRAYQTWQVLTNASREGARLAVIEGTTDAQIRDRVRAYLTSGGLKTAVPDGGIPIQRAVVITGTATASRVQINYPFAFMMLNPIARLVAKTDSKTGAPITMSAATVMRNE